jgi:hypothetical protein
MYYKNILIANFGLDADNSLMNAPKKMPYHGSIPHTCAHCQKEAIEPKTRQISSTFLVTEYVFQADRTKAIEAAADGCAFWQFFIRDFLDKDSRACRPDMYVQVSVLIVFPLFRSLQASQQSFIIFADVDNSAWHGVIWLLAYLVVLEKFLKPIVTKFQCVSDVLINRFCRNVTGCRVICNCVSKGTI